MLEDFFGESVVALVWSFTDRTDIPYRITRTGKPAKVGGTGYRWRCTCPSSQNRQPNCKHIRTMRELIQDGSIDRDDRYRLSDYGRSILKVEKTTVHVASTVTLPINVEAQALFAEMVKRVQARVG